MNHRLAYVAQPGDSPTPDTGFVAPYLLIFSLGLLMLAGLGFWRLRRPRSAGFWSNEAIRISVLILLAAIMIVLAAAVVFSSLLLSTYKYLVLENSSSNSQVGELLRGDVLRHIQLADISSFTSNAQPDLDLHAITPDGKRVGMNYATGQYENQIPGAIVSGNNQGSPEWILLPASTTAKFYVSSYSNLVSLR